MIFHDKSKLSRRHFLKGAAVAAGTAFGGPLILPSSARGADGAVAPSNRITLGCIGVGGMGTGNMQNFLESPDVQVVAVCDVDKAHRDAAKKIVDDKYAQINGKTHKGCDTYNDFRELLARPDIDAVMIATPDHWHALIAIAAAKAGKDMYSEKPLGLTVTEGRMMADAMKKYGRVFQTGSWQRSVAHYRFACELVRNGRIGKLHTIQVGLPGCGAMPPLGEEPVPDGFDYDMWLGPAPQAPYNKARCHWNFRYNFDYSGGHVTDWGAHHHDIAHWAMGTEHTGPVEVAGTGDFPRDGFFNVPTDFNIECTYANGVRMITSSKFPNGNLFVGSEGSFFVDRGGITQPNPTSLLTTVIKPNEIQLYKSDNHYRNFLDCVRSRAETITPAENAHRSITVAHISNIAMLLERKLRWDPAHERFVNDPEADRMLSRAMRSPWQL